jgi:hypothetical protein
VKHYHGLPITPATAAVEAVNAGHAFVSFAHSSQLPIAMEVCQSFAVDNGAFSAWRGGSPVRDWSPYYAWVAGLMRHPGFDFAVIPDVIDGDEDENDALVSEWPHGRVGAPVWHMHESIERLHRLCLAWPVVCLGSSGDFSAVGSLAWWSRMTEAMDAVCDKAGFPIAKLHGLRMLNPEVFKHLPLASADSTNIGRNVGIDKSWTGSYAPMTKEARASVIRRRIEHTNGAQRWAGPPSYAVASGHQEMLWA